MRAVTRSTRRRSIGAPARVLPPARRRPPVVDAPTGRRPAVRDRSTRQRGRGRRTRRRSGRGLTNTRHSPRGCRACRWSPGSARGAPVSPWGGARAFPPAAPTAFRWSVDRSGTAHRYRSAGRDRSMNRQRNEGAPRSNAQATGRIPAGLREGRPGPPPRGETGLAGPGLAAFPDLNARPVPDRRARGRAEAAGRGSAPPSWPPGPAVPTRPGPLSGTGRRAGRSGDPELKAGGRGAGAGGTATGRAAVPG